MKLRRRYRSLTELLAHELVRDEDAETQQLIRRLRHVRKRRWFSRAEFLEMCRWKSPRARRQYERNPAPTIRRVSRLVLTTRSERQRLALLTSLRGVGVPMASAILTLIDPERYGVLDIRVWRLLFGIRSVTQNPRGQGFTVDQCCRYLATLRHHARRLGVTVRTVEYSLFCCHKKYQTGNLYG
ncbi:MAG: hypothetical protein HY727_09625 [Candidatus Rokubacteria bacterium]|nr:hypothetical protein [Candidatus Rokubacteria bacterium]